jgi:glycosyl transferase, family 25
MEIEQSTKFSIPIYILALKDSDRSGPLTKFLESKNLDFEIFYGEDLRGSDVLPYQSGLQFEWLGRSMSGGEIGCLVSHRNLARSLAALDLGVALVLEEDANLTEDNLKRVIVLSEFIITQRKPSIIPLFYSNLTRRRFFSFYKLNLPGVTLIKPSRPTYGTVGYLINREAIALTSQTNLKFVAPADWPPEWSAKITYYVPTVKVIEHNESQNSLIEEERLKAQKNLVIPNLADRTIKPKWFLQRLRMFYDLSSKIDGENPWRLTYFKLHDYLQYKSPTLFRVFFKRIDVLSASEPYLKKFLRIHKYIYWMLIRKRFLGVKNYFYLGFKVLYSKIITRFRFRPQKNKRIDPPNSLQVGLEYCLENVSANAETDFELKMDFQCVEFSLIITYFNQGLNDLERSLSGILNQNRMPDEIIFIDGGSTNATTLNWLMALPDRLAKLDHLKDTKVIFKNIENIGIVGTRNFASTLATGDYLVFHDPDDELTSGFFLEMARALVSQPLAHVFHPNMYIRDQTGQIVNYWNTNDVSLLSLLRNNELPASSCISRTFFRLIGKYSVNMEHGMEDWDLWIRCAIYSANFAHVPKASYIYTSEGSDSRTANLNHFEARQRDLIYLNALFHLRNRMQK